LSEPVFSKLMSTSEPFLTIRSWWTGSSETSGTGVASTNHVAVSTLGPFFSFLTKFVSAVTSRNIVYGPRRERRVYGLPFVKTVVTSG
jgi:hypothetical protein